MFYGQAQMFEAEALKSVTKRALTLNREVICSDSKQNPDVICNPSNTFEL